MQYMYMYFLATRRLLYSERFQYLNSFNGVYVFTCSKIYISPHVFSTYITCVKDRSTCNCDNNDMI